MRIGAWDGTVETIVTSESAGWTNYWNEHGEGVILAGPAFGRLYTKFHDEDLILIRRKQE